MAGNIVDIVEIRFNIVEMSRVCGVCGAGVLGEFPSISSMTRTSFLAKMGSSSRRRGGVCQNEKDMGQIGSIDPIKMEQPTSANHFKKGIHGSNAARFHGWGTILKPLVD